MKCEEMYEENEEQMKKMKRISEKMVKVKMMQVKSESEKWHPIYRKCY